MQFAQKKRKEKKRKEKKKIWYITGEQQNGVNERLFTQRAYKNDL